MFYATLFSAEIASHALMPTRAFGLWTVLIGGLCTRGVGTAVGNRPRVGSHGGDRKIWDPANERGLLINESDMSVDAIWVRL
jgi:hypothetical protein